MAAKPLVSALIVSYNVKDLLLDSLHAFLTSSDVPVEAIVVDNASGDGSAEAVAERYPDVKLIRQPRNVGYGKANNIGLQECEGRFILLLNPDVTVGEGCVGRLADFLLVRPDVETVGPRLLRPEGMADLAARQKFPRSTLAPVPA